MKFLWLASSFLYMLQLNDVSIIIIVCVQKKTSRIVKNTPTDGVGVVGISQVEDIFQITTGNIHQSWTKMKTDKGFSWFNVNVLSKQTCSCRMAIGKKSLKEKLRIWKIAQNWTYVPPVPMNSLSYLIVVPSVNSTSLFDLCSLQALERRVINVTT